MEKADKKVVTAKQFVIHCFKHGKRINIIKCFRMFPFELIVSTLSQSFLINNDEINKKNRNVVIWKEVKQQMWNGTSFFGQITQIPQTLYLNTSTNNNEPSARFNVRFKNKDHELAYWEATENELNNIIHFLLQAH